MKKYNAVEIKILLLETQDVITSSGFEDNETTPVPYSSGNLFVNP